MKRLLVALGLLLGDEAFAVLPSGNFSTAPTNGFAPFGVIFTNTVIDATNFLWTFGDSYQISTTNAVATNLYFNAGVYTVVLEAVGPGGTNVFAKTNYITVTTPEASDQSPLMSIKGVVAPIKFFTNFTGGAVTVLSPYITPTCSFAVLRQATNAVYAFINEQFDQRIAGQAVFTSSLVGDTNSLVITLFP